MYKNNAGEDFLLEFVEKFMSTNVTGVKRDALWADFSKRIFTLMPSTRPFAFRDFEDVANHVSAFTASKL